MSDNSVIGSIGSKKENETFKEFYRFSEQDELMHCKSELDVYLEDKLYPINNQGKNDFEILHSGRLQL